MNATLLFQLLWILASVEQPELQWRTHAKQLRGMETMAAVYVDVAKAGALVSPAADAAILAAIGYEESRHRPYIEDGDCFTNLDRVRACWSVGPMQLSRATSKWLPSMAPELGVPTVDDMREPLGAVRIAYGMMRHWKAKCGKGPSTWLSAYAMGRCPHASIRLGRRRHALAYAIALASGDTSLAKQQPEDERTARKVEALLEADEPEE